MLALCGSDATGLLALDSFLALTRICFCCCLVCCHCLRGRLLSVKRFVPLTLVALGWCICAGLAWACLVLVVWAFSDSCLFLLLCLMRLGCFWLPGLVILGSSPCSYSQYLINSICFLSDSRTNGHLQWDGDPSHSRTLTRSDLLAGQSV